MKKKTRIIGILLVGYLPNLATAQFTCEGPKLALFKQKLCSDTIENVLEKMTCPKSGLGYGNEIPKIDKCSVTLIGDTANGENTFGAFVINKPGGYFDASIPSIPSSSSDDSFCNWSVVNIGGSVDLQVSYSPNTSDQLEICKKNLIQAAGKEKICANVIVSERFKCPEEIIPSPIKKPRF